jgi:N-acetylneuraminic acid mutarotase
MRATWNAKHELTFSPLPPLPHPLAFAAGVLVGQTVFVVGGQQSVDKVEATAEVWALDLAREGSSDFGWALMPSLPGPPRILALAAAQTIGGKPGLYVFSGRDVQSGRPTQLLSDAYQFDLARRSWKTLRPIEIDGKPRCVMAGNAVATSDGAILLLGGDSGEVFSCAEQLQDNKPEQMKLLESHPGFSKDIIRFDPIKLTCEVAGEMPQPSPVTTPCVAQDGSVILISGEARAGVRTPHVWRGVILR